MKHTSTARRYLAMFMAVLFTLTSMVSLHVQASQAAMTATHEVIAQEQLSVDRDQLKAMLDDEAVQEKLASMGVSPEQVEQRINSLTAEELAHFNAQLDEAPAAAGVVGIIVLFLVIFIITDMLCATNIFRFVNCVNR